MNLAECMFFVVMLVSPRVLTEDAQPDDDSMYDGEDKHYDYEDDQQETSSFNRTSPYLHLHAAFHDRMSFRHQELVLMKKMSKHLDTVRIKAAMSCLAIGAGDGTSDIAFVKHMAPNLLQFTSVEPCAHSNVVLEATMQRVLPNVEISVYEKPIQEFIRDGDSGGQKYDLVIMLYQKYYLVFVLYQKYDLLVMC